MVIGRLHKDTTNMTNIFIDDCEIDCNKYNTVSIDDIMSWNEHNSDSETVDIKRHFIEMFGDRIQYFYSVNDYMN